MSAVAAFALHLGRDAADDDDGIGHAHLLGEVGEVGEDALADVTTQHGELSVAMTVFDLYIIGLAGLDGERLVFGLPSEAEAATHATFGFFDHLAIDLQDIAVVGGQRVFHLTGESGLILTADTHGERVATHALGKAPGAEGGEVERLGMVFGLGRLACEFLIIIELYLHALAAVEVLQVVDGGILVVEFAGLAVDDVRVRQGSTESVEQRVGVGLCGRASVVAVEHGGIVGVRTNDGQRLDVL